MVTQAIGSGPRSYSSTLLIICRPSSLQEQRQQQQQFLYSLSSSLSLPPEPRVEAALAAAPSTLQRQKNSIEVQLVRKTERGSKKASEQVEVSGHGKRNYLRPRSSSSSSKSTYGKHIGKGLGVLLPLPLYGAYTTPWAQFTLAFIYELSFGKY